jgi:hypothetical protein
LNLPQHLSLNPKDVTNLHVVIDLARVILVFTWLVTGDARPLVR